MNLNSKQIEKMVEILPLSKRFKKAIYFLINLGIICGIGELISAAAPKFIETIKRSFEEGGF